MSKWTDEQLEAIEHEGENIIVSAGAGSGKTAVLTERVIRKLKKGIHVDNLLILTFTNAAAAEMKDRIRKSISDIKELSPELDNLDSAYITTFDSYALSIVKKYHYLLDLPKDIKVCEATLLSIYKKKIMSDIFDELYLEDNEVFNTFIKSFCNKNDEELKRVLLNIVDKLELKYQVMDYLNDYIENYYSSNNIDNVLGKYREYIDVKRKSVKDNFDELSSLVDDKFYNKLYDVINPIIICDDIEELKTLVDIRLPQLRGGDDKAKEVKEALKTSLDELKEVLSCNFDELKDDLLKIKDNVSIIVMILTRFFNRYNKLKKDNNLYDFTDIALVSIEILDKNPDICQSIKEHFHEILVDEYQDTSDIQELFISLISNNNVYMVGDIKQSIYRFRNANPKIFKDKYSKYQNHDGGMKIDLLNNFRSRREVLDDINAIFRQIMDEHLGGADYVVSHQMQFGNTSYEEIGEKGIDSHSKVIEYHEQKVNGFSNEEVEAFIIANDIKDKISSGYKIYNKDEKVVRCCNYSDFVILIDRSTSFELYKKIFEYMGIPLTLFKDEYLDTDYDLDIIKNIIDFIIRIKNNNEDETFTYDYVSLARSFLFQISDEEIFDNVTNKKIKDTSIYKLFSDISFVIDEMDIYHIIKYIFDKTEYLSMSMTANTISNREIRMDKILELASSFVSLGYDIYEFSDYLNDMVENNLRIRYPINTDIKNTARIMTIHKSKGLEYQICYFPSLYKKFNVDEIKDKFLYSDELGIICPYFDNGINETFLKRLYKNKYLEEEISERIRLFYVALTRAREHMIFILPIKELERTNEHMVSLNERLKYRRLSDIMNTINGPIRDSYSEYFIPDDLLTKDYLYPKKIEKKNFDSDSKIDVIEVNMNNLKEETKHFSKSSIHFTTKEELDNMAYGTKVHEILEMIDFHNPKYDNVDSFIKSKLDNFFKHPIMNDVMNAKVYKEYEFITYEDNIKYHGIIDCMLEYDDHITIIDYKLQHVSDEAYEEQLKGYQRYVEKVSNKKVSLYLFSIIDGIIKEI